MSKNKQPYSNRRTLWNVLPADVKQALLDMHQKERAKKKEAKREQG